MVVLCNGMIRSGSTWSFNVALQLLRSHAPNARAFGFYTEDQAAISEAIHDKTSNIVVKSHSLAPGVREYCRSGALKTIYTWRRPYDVVASHQRMFGPAAESWADALRNALRVWRSHRDAATACILSYEEIVRDGPSAVSRIATYLGLSLGERLQRQIAGELSLERVRRFTQSFDRLSTSRMISTNGLTYDKETLLHANHIQDGGIGYGTRLLGEECFPVIDSILREEGFGYLCEPPQGRIKDAFAQRSGA